MITVHFCIESFDPRLGGMEESALRLVQLLSGEPDIRFILYAVDASKHDPDVTIPGTVTVVNVSSLIRELIEPLAARFAAEARMESQRLAVLLTRQVVAEEMAKRPGDRHIVLSYFMTTAGFVAQHVASELHLPHVACSRGSDLGKHLFCRDAIAPLEFVAQRAARIVTTNCEHARFVRDLLCYRGKVDVIYNALPEAVVPEWRRSAGRPVKLVSLGGYSVKKGTTTLLRALGWLRYEGLPVELTIAGPTGAGRWESVRKKYAAIFGPRVIFRDWIDRSDVEQFLLSADIYCSASLSEGCSNATMLALALGMPIASSATGALVDLGSSLDHVFLSTPGRVEEFTDSLRTAVDCILNNRLTVDKEKVNEIVRCLSRERERSAWLKVIREVPY